MTVAKAPQFKSLEEYLAADPADLPEGQCEYWDGDLIPVMSGSLDNLEIADYLFMVLINAGIPPRLIQPGRVEVAVPGKPKTRYPDLVVLDEAHRSLLKKRATITDTMPPPRRLVEVVSPGNEQSDNYQKDLDLVVFKRCLLVGETSTTAAMRELSIYLQQKGE